MSTDAQIILSTLPSVVPKGMVACLAHYLMIKNALPPDPAEAMVLDPACRPSSPIVHHIKFRGYAPELYCLGKHLLPCKKFTPYCFLARHTHVGNFVNRYHKVTTKRCLCVIDCCTCRLETLPQNSVVQLSTPWGDP